MQIDFNLPLIGLNGQPATDETGTVTTVGKILSSYLANTNKGNPLKLMGLAKKMWNCEAINLDKADRKMLMDLVESAPEFTNLTKGALIELLDQKSDD